MTVYRILHLLLTAFLFSPTAGLLCHLCKNCETDPGIPDVQCPVGYFCFTLHRNRTDSIELGCGRTCDPRERISDPLDKCHLCAYNGCNALKKPIGRADGAYYEKEILPLPSPDDYEDDDFESPENAEKAPRPITVDSLRKEIEDAQWPVKNELDERDKERTKFIKEEKLLDEFDKTVAEELENIEKELANDEVQKESDKMKESVVIATVSGSPFFSAMTSLVFSATICQYL